MHVDIGSLEAKCVAEIEKQINVKLKSSLEYLSMASYFSRDDVQRPGFAEIFFSTANRDRRQVIELIELLNIQGRYLHDEQKSLLTNINIHDLVKGADGRALTLLINNLAKHQVKTSHGFIALQIALKKEEEVTKNVRRLVEICEEASSDNSASI